MSNYLPDVPRASTATDTAEFVFNDGRVTKQISKSDLEDSLEVTSQVVISGIINETATSVTPDSTYVNKWGRYNNASAITVTINPAVSQGWSTGS